MFDVDDYRDYNFAGKDVKLCKMDEGYELIISFDDGDGERRYAFTISDEEVRRLKEEV